MELNGTIIADEYAEAFGMWATRIVVTAVDQYWVQMACDQACGYGTSVIGCDAEAGIECLDLLSGFRGRNAEDLQLHATDQHSSHC